MSQKPAPSKFALAFSVGGILTSNLLGGFLLGYFLDRWLRTSPWLMLSGLVLGVVSAFWRLYRIMLELND